MERAFGWTLCCIALACVTACGGAPEEAAAPQAAPAPSEEAKTLPIPSVGGHGGGEGTTFHVGPMGWDVPGGWTAV